MGGVDTKANGLDQDDGHRFVYMRTYRICNIYCHRDMVQGTQLGFLLVCIPMAGFLIYG